MGRGFKIELTSQGDAKQLKINPKLSIIKRGCIPWDTGQNLIPMPLNCLCYRDAIVYPKLQYNYMREKPVELGNHLNDHQDVDAFL